MDRVRFESHGEVRYLYNDMSACTPEEAKACLQRSHEEMKQEPEKSVLVLANVKNIRFNKDIVQTFKDVTKKNAPYVKTTAVYGLEGFTKLLVNTVAKFSKREMKAFDDLEQAREWLCSQSISPSAMAS